MKSNEETKDLEYYRNNCEENYITTPISVLRYIGELENAVAQYKEEVDRLKADNEKFSDYIKGLSKHLTEVSDHLNLKEGESIIDRVKEMEGRIDYLENNLGEEHF